MEAVTRISITDRVQLRRLEIARQQIGAATPTKTAMALLDKALTEMGIGFVTTDTSQAPATTRDSNTTHLQQAG